MSDNFQRYGQEINTYMQSPTTWKVKLSEQHGKSSYVTFLFRYRSPGKFGVPCKDLSACAKRSSCEATGRQRARCTVGEWVNDPRLKSCQLEKKFAFVL